MKGSFWRLPLRITCPLTMRRRSPGPATTRLIKFTSACFGVDFRHTWPGGGCSPHMSSSSAPVGGWKTTTSATSGSEKRAPMRLTSTRWPIWSVGTIDSDGILYGLIRKAWIPSARPSATTTISTSSSNEPEADEPFFTSLVGVIAAVGGRLGGVRLRGGVVQRLGVDGLGGHLRVGGGSSLGRGVVQQPRLDDLLGLAGVAALADAGALADAAAQVVELGPADVAAGGDLDALDLRRVQRERALHADAEGLLADREGLAHALALALDDHALEDLRTAARALDDLEVHADAVARLELGDAPELLALESVDQGAHGEEEPAKAEVPVAGARRMVAAYRPCHGSSRASA